MCAVTHNAALRLAKAAVAIQMAPVPSERDKAFMARVLVLATLPHRDPGNVTQWQRRNGHFRLTVRPYLDALNRAHYPYGSIPRLLLIWMVTEAARTKNRRLELGRSLADFMREIGLSPNTGGGKKGDAKRLRDQMLWLFRAQFSFEEHGPSQGVRWRSMAIADAGEMWWSLPSPKQTSLFGSYIILGDAFFEAITEKPIPVDRRALQALRRSPLALDLYIWSTFRAYGLTLAGRPEQFIPWERLKEQFGAAYSDTKNFKRAFKQALRKVEQCYPGLGYRNRKGGLVLMASRPAVPPRSCEHTQIIHGEKVPSPLRRISAPAEVIPGEEG